MCSSDLDPFPGEVPQGVELAASLEDAVRDADIVLTLTAASAGRAVAGAAATAMRDDAVYADFTSAGPGDKRGLVELFGSRDVRLLDVAILGPVIQLGVSTPLMVAGEGGEVVAQLMRSVGAPVEVVSTEIGDAMAHKLLRSVFMKGLASVVVEAVSAGEAAGREVWVREQIARMIAGDGQAVIDRFLTGTRKHAARRSVEMRSTGAYLRELGVPSEMTDASASAMERILAADTAGGGSAT